MEKVNSNFVYVKNSNKVVQDLLERREVRHMGQVG